MPDPLFHFAGRFIGEGHSQNITRTRKARGNQMRDAGGQNTGFARAGPRQHQNRPVGDFDRAALFGVEVLQIGRLSGDLGARTLSQPARTRGRCCNRVQTFFKLGHRRTFRES